jgi:hypothetical protein
MEFIFFSDIPSILVPLIIELPVGGPGFLYITSDCEKWKKKKDEIQFEDFHDYMRNQSVTEQVKTDRVNIRYYKFSAYGKNVPDLLPVNIIP